MTCKCKNIDGTLSDTCFGTCDKKDYRQMDFVNLRNENLIGINKTEFLSTFIDKIDARISDLENLCHQKYKEGFRDGFEMAAEIYN